VRTWVVLLLVVNLLAGNLLATERVHASADRGGESSLHLDDGTTAKAGDVGTHGPCDGCADTCCQPVLAATLVIAAASDPAIAPAADATAFERRPVAVPREPPRLLLRH
jgi:hypothetical protein